MSGGHNRFPREIHGSADFHSPLPAEASSSFSPPGFVAEFLDSLAPDSPLTAEGFLSAALRASPRATLKVLIEESPEIRDAIEARLGKAMLNNLLSLSQEKDPELFLHEALRLAHRLERQDHPEASMALLGGVAQSAGSHSELGIRAERDIKVLHGQGEFGERFEFMFRRATHELSDPWMIAAFGAGSLAFRTAKLGVASRLWASSAQGFFPGRTAVGMIAAGAGLSVEAPVFLLVSKVGHQLSGSAQDWRTQTLAHELAAVGITLFCLKGAGGVSESALKAFQASGASRVLVPQAAMFGGILLAHRSEERLGLRPSSNASSFMADALATYFQFTIGGRLADGVLGTRFRALQNRLDWQSANVSRKGPGWELASPTAMAAGGSRRLGASLLDLTKGPMMSENHGDGGGKGPPETPRSPPRLYVVKGGRPPENKKPDEVTVQDLRFEPLPEPKPESGEKGQQVLDISLRRMLKSRPMDEKERQFRGEVDSVMMASAPERWKRNLEEGVVNQLPAPRRQELQRALETLHPELQYVFGRAATDYPWPVLVKAFTEMKLIRLNPGEVAEPTLPKPLDEQLRASLTAQVPLDYQELFQAPMKPIPPQLGSELQRLSDSSVEILGHWTQNAFSRLLMAQRLGLSGLPGEKAIVDAFRHWESQAPESE